MVLGSEGVGAVGDADVVVGPGTVVVGNVDIWVGDAGEVLPGRVVGGVVVSAALRIST